MMLCEMKRLAISREYIRTQHVPIRQQAYLEAGRRIIREYFRSIAVALKDKAVSERQRELRVLMCCAELNYKYGILLVSFNLLPSF
jgi:hypothetical protein